MKTRLRQGFTLIELLVVITIIALLASLTMPALSKFQERGNITKGISNARQIILALKLYASDHSSSYPDSASVEGEEGESEASDANTAFRQLFVEETLDSEAIFGCPISPFNPDGNIGSDAEKTQALETKENHWMMTKGLSDSASGSIPLIMENALSADWNPKWDNNLKGQPKRGRAWSTGIIIGLNDGSAQIMQLQSKKGEQGLKETDGKNVFTQQEDEEGGTSFEILDVLGGE